MKLYRNKDGQLLVRHSHGVYMVVNLQTQQNEGWTNGSAKDFTLLGEVPEGIAGGAKSRLTDQAVRVLTSASK